MFYQLIIIKLSTQKEIFIKLKLYFMHK